jgi:hypothetical protein
MEVLQTGLYEQLINKLIAQRLEELDTSVYFYKNDKVLEPIPRYLINESRKLAVWRNVLKTILIINQSMQNSKINLIKRVHENINQSKILHQVAY